jgi:hypothetical protein
MVIVGDANAECSTRIFILQLLKLINPYRLRISGSLVFSQYIIYQLMLNISDLLKRLRKAPDDFIAHIRHVAGAIIIDV